MKIAFCLSVYLLHCFWAIPKIQCQSSLGIEAGYGLPWAGEEISEGSVMFIGGQSSEIGAINWSYGAGKNYSISYSRFLSSSMEAKCMVSYLDGSTVVRTTLFSNSSSFRYHRSNAFWISPSLVFNLGKKRIRPYVYTGFVFGISPKIIHTNNTFTNGKSTETEYVFSGGAVYGISSGIGIKFYLKKATKWYFASEARLVSASYGPKKGELVRYYIDGTDVLSSISINEKKVIYKDKYIEDLSVPDNPNEPDIFSRRFYPFSSLGLNFGVYYTL
ncbi:MAG TPA: hypothetical protein VK168_11225 [Saprospiraceae bacterium]|nr:hypothetical protein [Saprospiraceae bacterium]